MFDGVRAGFDRGLNAGFVRSVHSNLQVLPVSFINHRRQFRQCDVISCCDLDDVNILENILSNCFPC